jgi:voltage-gated potassium channel
MVLMPFRRVRAALGPALWAAVTVLAVLFLTSTVIVYVSEHGHNPKFGSFRAALQWVSLTLFSGAPWSVQTAGGKTTSYVVNLLKPVSVATLTAAITSYLFQMIVRRGSGQGRTRVKNHILICGWSSKGAEIIREIRGRGGEDGRRPVVILAPLRANPTKDELTTFISGDPSKEVDLKRAGLERADVAIVLADNSYPDIDAEEMDSRTLLTTLAIESLNPKCYTCVEVVHSTNRDHFNRTHADELVVSAHLTGALLAHSAVARGLSKIVDDLLTYPSGDEFYWLDVPTGWVGMKFQEVLGRLKSEFDCLPLAIGRAASYITNPGADAPLEAGDRLLVLAKQQPVVT